MDSLLQLLFPVVCLICADSGPVVCSSCEKRILRVTGQREIEGTTLWAGAYYGDELAQLILLAKEENNAPARNYLAHLLVETFMSSATELNRASVVTLIPIPSSAAANRKRGFRHSYLLARDVASLIKRVSSCDVGVNEALRVNRKIADQSNLNRADRFRNMSGAYSADSRRFRRPSHQAPESIFLIDDLVTSGSSVQEGLRALRQLGITLSGVLAAGVSPRVFS